MEYRFIITGGGTSGHINPALTIADALTAFYEAKGDSVNVIFTGRKEGLEGELIPRAGYAFQDVEAKAFPMKPSVQTFNALNASGRGRKQCRALIDEFKPHAVISTGGFVSAPLLSAARQRRIPIMIHEANAFPGRANRLLSAGAELVMTGFPDTESAFPRAKKVIFTGNPVRKMIFDNDYHECRELLGIPEGQKFVYAMGGSLGSATISKFILESARRNPDVQFMLSSGKQHKGELDDQVKDLKNIQIEEYIEKPHIYMAAADVCVLRAGAVTCAELEAVGACGILIPYPHAAHDHQTFNAKNIEVHGGCMMMSDSDVNEGKLAPVLKKLLDDPEKRQNMRETALKLSVRDTTDRITNAIDEVINKKNC